MLERVNNCRWEPPECLKVNTNLMADVANTCPLDPAVSTTHEAVTTRKSEEKKGLHKY